MPRPNQNTIHWHIAPQTLATDLQAIPLARAIQDECHIENDQKSILDELTVMLVCTQGAQLEGTPKPVLTDILEIISTWQDRSPCELWTMRLSMPYKLLENWRQGWKEGQELFEADPAQLPTDALTPEQLGALEKADSPLA